MPEDGDYLLQLETIRVLPIQEAGPMDIAAAASLLWMVVQSGTDPRCMDQGPARLSVPAAAACRMQASLALCV